MKENAKKPINKKKIAIISVSLACVLLLAVGVVVLVTSLSRPTAHKVAMSALETVLADASIQTSVKEPEIVTVMDERHGYELISFAKKNKSEAVALLRVYAPDLYGCVKDLPEDWSSEEEMGKEITRCVSEAAIVEKEVELVFVKNGDDYQPVLTEEFVDAYYGGVLRLKQEYLLELVKGMEK